MTETGLREMEGGQAPRQDFALKGYTEHENPNGFNLCDARGNKRFSPGELRHGAIRGFGQLSGGLADPGRIYSTDGGHPATVGLDQPSAASESGTAEL